MYAYIENKTFVKTLNSNRSFTINGFQYSRDTFTKWSEQELNSIGVYSIEINNSNKKDEKYYINTNITYNFIDGKVVGSYGPATPKPLDDVLFVEGDEIPSDKAIGDIKSYGLKNREISKIKSQAGSLLAPTDWHVVKAFEVSTYSIPSDVNAYRGSIRLKSNEMENQINSCTTVDELKSLYEYIKQDDGNSVRPLAEFPQEVI